MAHTICVRNVMQDKYDTVWWDELLHVLDRKTVEKIMKHPKRLRYLAVLYGFQRIIELCIENKILPREVIRDINPTIIGMSNCLGACNRIRITKLPWIIAVHLQFILCVFITTLPMSLVGVQKYSEIDFVVITKINGVDIYIYVIIIAYAFFGLYRMALNIGDPFSFSQENHSFGFWGFYEYWTSEEVKNIRTIFNFRAKRDVKDGMYRDGDYGDHWVSTKFEVPIRRTIKSDLPKTHNLYGRVDEIMNGLLVNKRTDSFWNKFNLRAARNSDDGSSASESVQIVSTPRRTLRKSISKRISEFSTKIPSTLFSLKGFFTKPKIDNIESSTFPQQVTYSYRPRVNLLTL